MFKKMINTNLIYSFSQIVIDSSGKDLRESFSSKDAESDENLIVEDYEGTCEECEKDLKKPSCPVCIE